MQGLTENHILLRGLPVKRSYLLLLLLLLLLYYDFSLLHEIAIGLSLFVVDLCRDNNENLKPEIAAWLTFSTLKAHSECVSSYC